MGGRDLRVMQFIKGLDIGGIHGGADLFGLNLACALKEIGVDSRLCVFYQMGTPAEEAYRSLLSSAGVEVIFLSCWKGKTSFQAYFSGMRKLAAYLHKEHIHLLHSHFHVGTAISMLLKLFRRVPHVARTAHVDREWLRGWEGLIQGLLIRFFIFVLFPLLVDIEGGVSQTAVDVLNQRWLARLLRKRASVIYNSIPVVDFRQSLSLAEAARMPKSKGKFTIGSVGRLTEQKGYCYLVKAAQEVIRELPEANFWIAGSGPLLSDLEDQARRLDVNSAVQFLGKRDDVPALLDLTDLFVLPSVYEGLPTVVLESMSRGIPVIGTNIPGTREIIQDGQNGLLVPARDPHALALAILWAAGNPQERAQMAAAALETLKDFTVERAAEKYADLYRGLK